MTRFHPNKLDLISRHYSWVSRHIYDSLKPRPAELNSFLSGFGSLTCQPSLPDIPPQQIPSLGRGVPQLLADGPSQLQLGRPSRACHCGSAGDIIPDRKNRRDPLFLGPVIPAVKRPACALPSLSGCCSRCRNRRHGFTWNERSLRRSCVTFLQQRRRTRSVSEI